MTRRPAPASGTVLALLAAVTDPDAGTVEPLAVLPVEDRGEDTLRDLVAAHPGVRAVVLDVAVNDRRTPPSPRAVDQAVATALAVLAAEYAADARYRRCGSCGYPILTPTATPGRCRFC